MNNDRRKQIKRAISDTEALAKRWETFLEEFAKLKEDAEDLKNEVESIRDDEKEYFDNMPESLQGGYKGQMAEAAVSQLDDAMSALDTLVDLDLSDVDLEQVVGYLDEAAC